MPSQVIGIILTAGAVLLIAYWIVSAEWRQKRKRATRDGIIERQTRSRHVPDYDENGQNQQGQYNRLYDVKVFRSADYSTEGFRDPRKYPVYISDHARMRIRERLGLEVYDETYNLVMAAYQYGKSVLQVDDATAERLKEAQKRYQDSVLLMYRDYVFVFTTRNLLITIYKDENAED